MTDQQEQALREELAFWRAQAEKHYAVIAAVGRTFDMLATKNLLTMLLPDRAQALVARVQHLEREAELLRAERDYERSRS